MITLNRKIFLLYQIKSATQESPHVGREARNSESPDRGTQDPIQPFPRPACGGGTGDQCTAGQTRNRYCDIGTAEMTPRCCGVVGTAY